MAIRSPRWLFVAALVLAAPDTPGVYELWDDDEVILLSAALGGRQTLRSRLAHELLAQDEGERHITHFSWEITFAPAARERELRHELSLSQEPAAGDE